MRRMLHDLEDVLRGRPTLRAWWLIVLCGFLYGAVMGSFGGRLGQVTISAIKVPMLVVLTTALSLPSFFILNTLLGLRDDFGQALRALVASQSGFTIILASLAPLTALFYVSTDHYYAAILFNGLMFGAAALGSQWLLRRGYRTLIARSVKHRWLLRAWLVVYAFVGIQMGWLARPFIGHPDRPVEVFRADVWENAYVVVFRMIGKVIFGNG